MSTFNFLTFLNAVKMALPQHAKQYGFESWN